jgi:hypothetical protein
MQDLQKWLELCELASKEQDPEKLLRLKTEINRFLEEKQQRLKKDPSKRSQG